MKHLFIIGPTLDSLVNFRADLLICFVNAGFKVTAIAVGYEISQVNKLNAIGVDYLEVDFLRNKINPLEDIVYFYRLRQLIKEARPDIVLAYTIKPVVYGMTAARLAGVAKRYAMITGLGYAFNESRKLKQKFLTSIAKYLYKKALINVSCVIFQNNQDRHKFVEHGLMRSAQKFIRTMGSGVNLQRYKYVAPDNKSPFVFLLVARLLVAKGIVDFVEAATEVLHKYPQTRFALLGPFEDGPDAVSSEIVHGWVDSGVIEYWGSTDDVRPFIERCSAFVLPTVYKEGVPRSILEALAIGRPIITTDAPGCADTVQQGENGFLVRPGDVSALKDAMIALLEASPERIESMGTLSREIAEKIFDVAEVNSQILRLIQAD